MYIYLVRNGETENNNQSKSYNAQLSQHGKDQALSAVAALDGKKINYLFSSPFTRAYQTAEIIANEFDLDIEISSLLVGGNFSEIEEKSVSKYLHSNGSNFRPNNHTILDTLQNIESFFDVTDSEDFPSIIVTHDIVIRMFIANVINIPVQDIWKFKLDHCGITTIDLQKKQIITLNNTSHLIGRQSDASNKSI